PADIVYGTALSAAQLNATASVPGTLTYSPASGAFLNAGPGQTLTANFTPTDYANYSTATKTVTINVIKATPTLTWSNPADITYGTTLTVTQLNATASTNGTVRKSPRPNSSHLASSYAALTLNITPTDAANFNAASKSVT